MQNVSFCRRGECLLLTCFFIDDGQTHCCQSQILRAFGPQNDGGKSNLRMMAIAGHQLPAIVPDFFKAATKNFLMSV